MASRVEKYYDNKSTSKKRVVRNKELYKAIYAEDETYSNIEGIVETPVTNEIDIVKVQAMILKQEEEEKKRMQLVKKDLELPDMESLEETLTKNYDIRDVLAKAKDDVIEDNKPRKLKDFDFDGLKARLSNKEVYTEEEQERDIRELQELIHTIAGDNPELNRLADRDLSLDMFADLKEDTNEIKEEDADSIKKIIAEAKRLEEAKEIKEKEDNVEMDKAFYTSTLNLKPKDFADGDEEEHMPTILKIFIILLIIVLTIIFVVVGYQLIKKVIL